MKNWKHCLSKKKKHIEPEQNIPCRCKYKLIFAALYISKWQSVSVANILYDKQNNTWLLVDMGFLFSCSTRHLTHLLCPLLSETFKDKIPDLCAPMYYSLFIIFCNLLVNFVKFSKSFTTEVIKNIIGMFSHFILWDGWLYMGSGRVRFQGEMEV